MPSKRNSHRVSTKCFTNRGSWTAEEDMKLVQYVEIHGPKRWRSVAVKSGLNRCGKSCRLRWLNYLRPEIKRGNISDAEEDLILRLHRLLGNRWSLIAGRLPGRTDNEIKNYWNSQLSKKAKLMENLPAGPPEWLAQSDMVGHGEIRAVESINPGQETEPSGKDLSSDEEHDDEDDDEDVFDFSRQGTYGLQWVKQFLEQDS